MVAGSRNWPEMLFVTQKMIELIPAGALVITGGAGGVDDHAHREAQRLGYPTMVMLADWHTDGRYNPRAGLERNIRMLATENLRQSRVPVGEISRHGPHDSRGQQARDQGLLVHRPRPGARHHRTRPRPMSTDAPTKPTVTCTNHCAVCGLHTHSLAAYDAHLEHDDAGWPHCLAPPDLVDRDGKEILVALSRTGRCAVYREIQEPVTIWTLAANLERARAYFRPDD